MIGIQQAMHAAHGHHQAGRFADAEAIYQRILSVSPNHADALHLLGVLAGQEGNNDTAMELINRAITVNPSNPVFYCNLGNILRARDLMDDAAASFRKAIAIKRNYAEAYNNLGVVLHAQGNVDDAVASFRKALSFKHGYAEAYYNLGTALHKQGNMNEASESFHKAISCNGNYVEAYLALGTVLHEQGELDGSLENYRKALLLSPDSAGAYNNMGVILLEQGKLDEAEDSYRKALSRKPDYTAARSNLIYLHAFARDISLEAECALAAEWEVAALNAEERKHASERIFTNPPRTGRKLRIGVVSAEIGHNCVAQFLEPLLEQFDRGRVHVTLYPTIDWKDSRSARMRGLVDEVASLAECSDSSAAERIRSDRMDILIDTSGHLTGCHLGIFAHRAAPVQCHYIGYHGTTGLTEMDWFIADEVLLPPSCDSHFRERIWRLPRLWEAYRGDTSLPESNWRPSSDGTIRLGSFNNLTKVREEALGLWAKVMHELPESRLMLKSHRTTDPYVLDRIRSELYRHDIGDDRIEFFAWTPGWNSHMALYDRLDIALDTIPLNSGTTAYDALWMGVPIVALEGDWMGGRMTTSILTALGKPEWIARSPEEYVEIVVALARDVAGRSELRGRQRQLMAESQLCDGQGLARSMEEAFEAMFDKWLARQSQ